MGNRVKKKASVSEVEQVVKPYLVKRFLRSAYIESCNVQRVSDLLKNSYSNVVTDCKPENGCAVYTINIKGFFCGGKLKYEIKNKGKKIITHDPLSWIDRFEEWDALFGD